MGFVTLIVWFRTWNFEVSVPSRAFHWSTDDHTEFNLQTVIVAITLRIDAHAMMILHLCLYPIDYDGLAKKNN